MTKDELWKFYTDRNPQFTGEGNVTMPKAGLKKLFDQTWEQATKEAEDRNKRRDEFKDLFNKFK